MMIPLHAAVMFLQRMFVRKKAGMSLPWSVVMAIGMMALIVMHPAWYRLRPMRPVIIPVTLGVGERCGHCTLIAMIVPGGGSSREHQAGSSGCHQQQRGNRNPVVHDVPPCDEYWAILPLSTSESWTSEPEWLLNETGVIRQRENREAVYTC